MQYFVQITFIMQYSFWAGVPRGYKSVLNDSIAHLTYTYPSGGIAVRVRAFKLGGRNKQ